MDAQLHLLQRIRIHRLVLRLDNLGHPVLFHIPASANRLVSNGVDCTGDAQATGAGVVHTRHLRQIHRIDNRCVPVC